MPRFEPFRGLRYQPDVAPLAQVIAPPYDVISATERAHLAFVGDGYRALRERVERLGLEDRVHVLPAVAAVEVPAFIRTADAVAVLYTPSVSGIEFALPNGFLSYPDSVAKPVIIVVEVTLMLSIAVILALLVAGPAERSE